MSRAELVRALASLVDTPGGAVAPVADALGLGRAPTPAEHTDLFALQLHPYASVHLGPEGQLGGVARDRVAGFFRALGVVPAPEPDHLVVLLSAYAELVDLDDGDGSRARHARTVLLHEHVLPWVPRLASRAAELGSEPHARWAHLLRELLAAEVELLGPAPTLPLHLREAPGLPDPRDEGDDDRGDFLAAVLAPVRSGLVIARADLARAAHELGVGLRIGERRFTLRSLLAQDAAAVLRFLAAEAERQRADVPGTDPTAVFWRDRLTTTADVLRSLARAPADSVPS